MAQTQEFLSGRDTALVVAPTHFVLGSATMEPFPAGHALALFGMGCFWGAERLFWQAAGVLSTQVGYGGGATPNPLYEEVCSGQTGHAELVRVVFDPNETSYAALLAIFWEGHDPTQGMRQGNDVGTQYRSLLGWYGGQEDEARASAATYAAELQKAGRGAVTTELVAAPHFYYAEDYHQQYLGKNPNGYCGLGGTGVACPLLES